MTKEFFTNRMVLVTPTAGGEPYQTWLLSTWLSDFGRVYCVSGPEVLFPTDYIVTELDGSPVEVSK